MDKVILISETAKETRIAIQEDGELVELYVEKPERTRMIGNIYKGKVENVIPGIQAAFVDIATPHNAFLPFSEINNPQNLMTMMGDLSDNEEEDEEDEVDLKPKHTRPGGVDSANLQKGQDILVQVIKEPFASKGARVTTDISLPGRFLVLVPNIDYIGISKKIHWREERRRLRKIARAIKPKNFGLIIRTVAGKKESEALEADLKQLMKEWKDIEDAIRNEAAPACVYRDMEMASVVARDL